MEAPSEPTPLRILSSAPPKPRIDQLLTEEDLATPPPPPALPEAELLSMVGEPTEEAEPTQGDIEASPAEVVDIPLEALDGATDSLELTLETEASPAPEALEPPRRRPAPSLPRRPQSVATFTQPSNETDEPSVTVELSEQEPEITEIEPAAEAAEPPAGPSRVPRPPPPRQKRQPTSEAPVETFVDQSRKRVRTPWWEEMFSEDFARADHQLPAGEIAKEVDFIEAAIGLKPGGIILDLGCGSGHHSVELAARGYGVVGFDLSVFQLAVAAELAQDRGQRINFLQGDMREMAFEETFDGVVCWNTTFGYFEEEKNFAVAQRVFRALRPGGMLLLDVLNRDYVTAHEPSQAWFDGDACVCMDDPYVDYITSRLRIKRSLIFDDGRTRECVYSLRLYALHELGKLLHDVGFRVCQASGHPTTPGAFFGPYSPRIIMVAQRP